MKTIKLITLICLTAWMGCISDDENPVSPKDFEMILGKWELIALGQTKDDILQPYTPDGSYTEYLSNGKIRNYYSFSGRIEEEDCIYELDAEYLYKYFNRKTHGTNSDQIYKYSFGSNKDELRLEIIRGMIPTIANYPFIKVYKRIKE